MCERGVGFMNLEMFFDVTFASGSDIVLADELPGGPTNLFYIPPAQNGGKDGVLIRVYPRHAKPWLGCFAFGHFGIPTCAVIASPQPEHLLVIAAGAGYVLRADNPAEWKSISCAPIRQVGIATEQRYVWLADFTTVLAYSVNGLAWKTKRLCWDDLQILGVEEDRLIGIGYDPTNSAKPNGTFEVDLLTGGVIRSDFEDAYKQRLF